MMSHVTQTINARGSKLLFLRCRNTGAHISQNRFLQSEQRLRDIGANTTAIVYAGTAHFFSADELGIVGQMLKELAPRA